MLIKAGEITVCIEHFRMIAPHGCQDHFIDLCGDHVIPFIHLGRKIQRSHHFQDLLQGIL